MQNKIYIREVFGFIVEVELVSTINNDEFLIKSGNNHFVIDKRDIVSQETYLKQLQYRYNKEINHLRDFLITRHIKEDMIKDILSEYPDVK